MDRDHRGKPIKVSGTLYLPAGSTKVPAMIVHHGSGGISDAREVRYARELVDMGVAALVIDSFTSRAISTVVSDQSLVSAREMTDDAFGMLKTLAQHPRVKADRIGIVGFSKGGSVALLSAHERNASRSLPAGLRFALHVPFYPSCSDHFYKPKITSAPILMLLGAADTYINPAICEEYAGTLKAQGAKISVTVYPGAQHGFDGVQTYTVAKGENWRRCVFDEQANGTWKERTSGEIITDAQGRRIDAAYQRALAACRTYGVSGAPDSAAKAQALTALKAVVRTTLIEGK